MHLSYHQKPLFPVECSPTAELRANSPYQQISIINIPFFPDKILSQDSSWVYASDLKYI